MRTELVIFDCDGVILDTFPFVTKVYDIIAEEFNIKKPNNQDFYKEFFELDWRKGLAKWGITLRDDINKSIEIFEKSMNNFKNKIKPFNNIDFVLEKLHKNYLLAVVSNNQKSNFVPLLEKFNLKKYFKAIFGIDDGEFKPDPDLIIKCMNNLKVNNKQTVFVGDMKGDIMAGRAAKLKKIIAVTYGFHNTHKLKGADIIIDSPIELIEAVK